MNVFSGSKLNMRLSACRATLVLCLLLFSFSSSSKPANEELVWQGGYDYVAMVTKDGGGNQGNQHPVELTPKQIYQLLASIHIAEAEKKVIGSKFFGLFSDDDDKPASFDSPDDMGASYETLFTDAELKKLSPAISRALARARPHQDIAFSISGRHEGFLGKSQLSTTARVFFSDNALHLIFGEVYVDIAKKYRRKGNHSDVPQKIDHQFLKHFRLKLGERNDENSLPVRFIQSDSHTLYEYNGNTRADWLVIDVNRFTQNMQQSRSLKNKRHDVIQGTDRLEQKTDNIDQEQEQLKRKVDRLERLIEAKERAAVEHPPATPASVPTKSLEQRLSELKRLYEQGYVNEAMYNEKVRLLLEEL